MVVMVYCAALDINHGGKSGSVGGSVFLVTGISSYDVLLLDLFLIWSRI